MINTWAELLVKYWQYDQLSALLAPYKDQPIVPVAERGSVQGALEIALRQAPEKELSFIAFPARLSRARTTRPSSCEARSR